MSTPTPTPTQQPASSTSDHDPSNTTSPADELIDSERHRLIMQLLRAMEEPDIDSVTWACLWFADMPIIRRMIERLQDPEYGTMLRLAMRGDVPKEMILACNSLDRPKKY